MRKGTDAIGLPVIAFDTGEKFETTHDLIFDQNENRLLGFVVDEGGWFSSAKVLPLSSVQAIGPDGIIVPSKDAVVRAETDEKIHGVLQRNNVLKGTKIMTTDGRDLGTMVDLYFDEQTGEVQGYEVSGGLFADAATGRSFVPAPHTLKIGQDVAFVPPETADLMDEQVGGIKGALQSASDKVQETAQKTGEKLSDAADTAGQKLQETTAKAGDKLQEVKTTTQEKAGGAVAGAAIEQTRGRRVMQMVQTEQGLIVAAPGQIVTDDVIARARFFNKERELMQATGMQTGDAAKASAGGAIASATDSVGTAAQSAASGVSDLLEKAKAKVSEVQEKSAQAVEEQRIKNALGRPVTRVILDREDNVILNVGELITNQAVERARAAGVLDILVNSAYDKTPELSQEQLRAPEPGAASLERQKQTT